MGTDDFDGDDPAVDDLYRGEPESFLAGRRALVDAARSTGDKPRADRLAALRKPTRAAVLVNRLTHDEPGAVDELLGLGSRLRAATKELDPAALRELTERRRALVDRLTRQALSGVPSNAALRDDVSGTFDAAIADSSLAPRLGRLERAERWSGFGVADDPGDDADSGARLRLVAGGSGRASSPRAKPAGARRSPSRAEPADGRAGAQQRTLDAARQKAADAASATRVSERHESEAGAEIERLTAELAQAQHALDAGRTALAAARRATRTARTREREAQAALRRVERR